MKQPRHVLFTLALGSASAFGGNLPNSAADVEESVNPERRIALPPSHPGVGC